MKSPLILASALLVGGVISTLAYAQTPAPSRGTGLPPEVEAAIKAQADALKSQPATAMPAPRNTMPPPLASGKAGAGLVVGVMAISENRNISVNGQGSAQMSLSLAVTGETPPGAMLRQVTVAKSVDDAGREIPAAPVRAGTTINTSLLSNNSRLGTLFRNNPGGATLATILRNNAAAATVSSSVTMGAPQRGAKNIASVEGQLEIYIPSEEDGSVVMLKNVKARAGKPLDDPVLAKNGIEFVMLTPETLPDYQARTGRGGAIVIAGNPNASPGAQFYVRDPGGKLVGFVALDAAGMPMNTSSGGLGGGDGGSIFTLMTAPGRGGAPTDDPTIAVFIATPESVKSYPFRIENVPLP